jgi:(4S)-4-hydroxy-5-phosphonooxypentane-2,3-dione isomerase
VRRFDVLQDEGDPAHVVLSEVYVDQAAADAHKQTAHYARWRDAVAGMMAQPRSSTRFTAVAPGEDGW